MLVADGDVMPPTLFIRLQISQPLKAALKENRPAMLIVDQILQAQRGLGA